MITFWDDLLIERVVGILNMQLTFQRGEISDVAELNVRSLLFYRLEKKVQ